MPTCKLLQLHPGPFELRLLTAVQLYNIMQRVQLLVASVDPCRPAPCTVQRAASLNRSPWASLPFESRTILVLALLSLTTPDDGLQAR